VSSPCCNCICMLDKLCNKTALISVCFSFYFINLSLLALQICSLTMRLLTVSARSGGVSTDLLSSDSSSLLWEPSSTSWCVTILCVGSFLQLIVRLLCKKKHLLLVNIIFIHNQRIIHIFQMHTHNRNFHS
jgi:hypothetical protein